MTVRTSLSKQPKSWFKRKRFWVCVNFVLFVYFCFVPSRTRISVETTGVTEPLTVNGPVDYLGVFERTYIDKLSPPENNGQRLLIAACGPRVLEQVQLANICTWEEIQTHESGKSWFENQWIPLCEHLYIDPYRRPMFYDKLEFFSFFEKHFSQQKEAAGVKPKHEDAHKYTWDLFQKLSVTTWKRSDYPEVGKWLDEYSEVLDYFGLCVRKPNFTGWHKPHRDDDLASLLLPDVQSNRAFARCLQVRITERIGRGDIEGAWYDVMSMKHLTYHYAADPILVTNLVGIAINGIATQSIKLILKNHHLTEEQLAKFSNDLNILPTSCPDALLIEQAFLFQRLQYLKNKKWHTFFDITKETFDQNCSDILGSSIDENSEGYGTLRIILPLTFDMNIAGKRLTKLIKENGLKGNRHFVSNPVLRRQYAERWEESIKEVSNALSFKKQRYRIPLIRTRSKLVAECIFVHFSPAVTSALIAFDRYDAQKEMTQIAIALERYKLAYGEYPEKLETLVPKYLDIVPIDPATGRTTFVYKLRDTKQETKPDAKPLGEMSKQIELPYILYSLGPNNKDDGGITLPVDKNKDFVF